METTYTSYTRRIDNKMFFCVKKYSVFPDLDNAPKILESFGMHTNFYRACSIAQIDDPAVIRQLAESVLIVPKHAKVIHFNKARSISHSILRNAQHLLSKLRLAGMN